MLFIEMINLRAALLFALLTMACAAPPLAGNSPTLSPVSSSPPAITPSSSPSASVIATAATPIPLPTTALLSAPSRDIVWALIAGSALFRSSDRGQSWERRPLPPASPNLEVSFVDDREGWVSSAGSPTTQCQSQKVGIWHTADGGSTWEQLAMSGLSDAQCKSALSFVDAKRGFLVGSDSSHAPVIYRTGDGGRSWSASRPLADAPGFTTVGGVALHTERVRASGATLLVPVLATGGQGQTYVYRSVDGGATWSYASRFPHAEGAGAIVTLSRWLQIISSEASQETVDGGATWHAFTTDYSQAAPIAPDIVFGDQSVGYATVRGGIQRTVDGGAHWSSIKTPGT